MYHTPDLIFQELFIALQKSGIFSDGKIIADALPKASPGEILKIYRKEKDTQNFNLENFFHRFFLLSSPKSIEYISDASRPVSEHIEILWDILKREANEAPEGSSLIPLPHPYIVPGGRFSELYYWDSYFTMLGLQVSGKIDLIENMLDNFSWLIENLGFIPNGNRTYFMGRSQPPFYALMVDLLVEEKGEGIFERYLPFLEKEYAFWMSGKRLLDKSDSVIANNHVVKLGDGRFLNRYFDQYHLPRPEMYAKDLELAKNTNRPADNLFSDIRAACESGWDFSARWLRNAQDLTTIHTTEILPVDLNCLIYFLEISIARGHATLGNTSSCERFYSLAKKRKSLIMEYFWDEESGFFHDYDFVKKAQTEVLTMAGIFPLLFKIATQEQARQCAEIVNNSFLKAGGFVTTLVHSGQQWDAPNGWAPLQWIGVQGLNNYGFSDLANQASKSWQQLNIDIYHQTGKLLEKYNVEDRNLFSGEAEYEVQDGFGWTNGVLLKLLSEST